MSGRDDEDLVIALLRRAGTDAELDQGRIRRLINERSGAELLPLNVLVPLSRG